MLVLLLPGSSLPDMKQASMVMTHFQHHVVDHGQSDLGFWEYLITHFGKRTHNDVQHKQLPFHDATTNHAPMVYVQPGPTLAAELQAHTRITQHATTCGKPHYISGSVFQPPRS